MAALFVDAREDDATGSGRVYRQPPLVLDY